MPFVVGILRTELEEALSFPMEEALIIDIDKNEFIRTPYESDAHDLNLLPPNYSAQLRKALKNTKNVLKKQRKDRKANLDERMEKDLNYQMSVAKEELVTTFSQFFVIILGGYRNFISIPKKSFGRENFISSHPPDVQPFLKAFSGSQMFERFLEERLQGLSEGGFEKMIDRYEKLSAKLAQYGMGDDDIVPNFQGKKGPSKKGNFLNSWSNYLKKGDSPPPAALPNPQAKPKVQQQTYAPQFIVPQTALKRRSSLDDSQVQYSFQKSSSGDTPSTPPAARVKPKPKPPPPLSNPSHSAPFPQGPNAYTHSNPGPSTSPAVSTPPSTPHAQPAPTPPPLGLNDSFGSIPPPLPARSSPANASLPVLPIKQKQKNARPLPSTPSGANPGAPSGRGAPSLRSNSGGFNTLRGGSVRAPNRGRPLPQSPVVASTRGGKDDSMLPRNPNANRPLPVPVPRPPS